MPEPITATFRQKIIAALGPFTWLPFFLWEQEFYSRVIPVVREEIREPTDPAAEPLIEALKAAQGVNTAVALINLWIEEQESGHEQPPSKPF